MSSKKGTLSRVKTREKIDGWLFVMPFVISTLVFFAGPLVVAFILSFKEYSFLDQNTIWQAKWVGFDNYINAFKDPIFKRALLNTTLYSLGVVPIQLVIALILALIVDSDIKGKTFFRVAYYIPTVTSTVAVSVMFMFIFKTDGLLNKFLKLFGIPPYNWFGDVRLALPSIMGMAIWSSVGLYMIIFLAGLQDIPHSLYEAAWIDGANKWQQFWYVTLPLLRPTFFFNLVVSLIGTFQVFDQAYVVSGGNGGPLNSTMTVVLYLYRTGFRDFKMGYACAIAFILFAIIFILTLIQKKLFGEETQYQ
ncbi:carbohydrate ABC transporter permease [Thermobrachium celere]|uniref:N-Acetyl-D-glucosamine ABC transport system, permease protein 1 n=1 Tax=Thermobrachium celere DSM 8682 TaxID=941824 RepID=R7RUU2_9CLOT|nr:sugar ABC transporter permease [Thermobrachium celere]GFR34629.1 ABC transporter permease [Thermobrachium celere]CDF59331.1 N-Acetyl-D-glucosamine ABC transport system, permease protein 1 [Thermobrachium celere DSM 8682]